MTTLRDPDAIEALAAVCEASRGGRVAAPIGAIHACSGLNGRQLAQQLPALHEHGLIARHQTARGVLPTPSGLALARLL